MSANQQALLWYGWAVASTLLSWLVAYYKLDESSGNATDSVWGFNLTNNGTCTYSAFLINNWVTTWASKWLSVANDLWLNGSSQPRTVSIRIKPTSTITTQQTFVSFSDFWRRIACYIERFSSNCRLIRVRGWIAADVCSKAQTFSAGTTYHLCWRYNWSTLNLKINNGTATTASSVGNGSGTWYSDDVALWAYIWWIINYTGQIDEVWFWNRSITDAEVTELYNAGAWKQYPF